MSVEHATVRRGLTCEVFQAQGEVVVGGGGALCPWVAVDEGAGEVGHRRGGVGGDGDVRGAAVVAAKDQFQLHVTTRTAESVRRRPARRSSAGPAWGGAGSR